MVTATSELGPFPISRPADLQAMPLEQRRGRAAETKRPMADNTNGRQTMRKINERFRHLVSSSGKTGQQNKTRSEHPRLKTVRPAAAFSRSIREATKQCWTCHTDRSHYYSVSTSLLNNIRRKKKSQHFDFC